MKKEDFNILVGKYISGNASDGERRLLEEYYTRLATQTDPLSAAEEEVLRKQMLAAIFEKAGIQTPVIKMRRNGWRKYAAAAAVVAILGSGSYFLFFNRSTPKPVLAQSERFKNDVAPGGNKAVLTLANGSRIILDSAHTGKLAQQGNTNIIKTDNGQLTYDLSKEKSTEIFYNTLSTPRGGQYQLDLPDGSRVWLDASSSIRYPTAFTGGERKVEITGEAYFEVAKDLHMPFTVSARGMSVQVLGTHFNINAYHDEAEIKTTLLEGSVKVKKGNDSVMIAPGGQAQLNKNGSLRIMKNADIDEAVAWKNGTFDFNNASIETIMRQMTRWYDVEVEYDAKISQHYIGKIYRSSNASQVLNMLELIGGVHFRIEGKKIIVTE